MWEDLKNKIKNRKIILFGEIHGTKQIPELLLEFFSEIAREEDFNVCLEIPENFQDNIESFFQLNNLKDGRNSLEYFNLIKNLKSLNEKYNKNIKIFCIDADSNISINNGKNIQNLREKIIAENILKSLENKKTFVILGSIHAYKYPISFQGIDIISAGNILFKRLKDKMFSINILPTEGEFYNFGIKKITDNQNNPFNEGFDYILKIRKVTPCSFL